MLKLDLSDFTRAAKAFGRRAEQEMPFALSRSMNNAAKATRNEIITQTWPTHVHVRDPSFIRWALNVKYATKRSLAVEIFDEKAQGRAHLGLHDTVGVKSARAVQAVPGQYIRKNGCGVPRNQLPRALPNSFPLTQDFNRVTREELERAFPCRMEEAIRTAFRNG